MFPLFLLFGAIAGVIALASQDHHAAPPPPAPQLALPPPVRPPMLAAPAPAAAQASAPNAIPRPIEVLCEILRAGGTPPAFVVQHAIAEAHSIGRTDLATELMMTFLPDQVAQTQAPTDASNGGTPALSSRRRRSRAHPPTPTGPSTKRTPASPVAASQVVDAPSPIQGVPDAAWSHFCTQLVRESPLYESAKFAGRYRHRKDRLAEIGFDPDMVLARPTCRMPRSPPTFRTHTASSSTTA